MTLNYVPLWNWPSSKWQPVPKTITARQSLQARSLLKWNLHDLASKTNLTPKYLERFERSLTRLTMPEAKQVITVYEKNGIIFLDNMDVMLEKKEEEVEGKTLNFEAEKQDQEDALDIRFDGKEKKEEGRDDTLWVHTPAYTGPDRRTAQNQVHFTGSERRKDRQNLVQRALDKYKDKDK